MKTKDARTMPIRTCREGEFIDLTDDVDLVVVGVDYRTGRIRLDIIASEELELRTDSDERAPDECDLPKLH